MVSIPKSEPDMRNSLVQQVVSTAQAFVAVNIGGTVVGSWDKDHGGSIPETLSKLVRIKFIASTESAFVAVNQSGTVVGAWGDAAAGEPFHNICSRNLTTLRR